MSESSTCISCGNRFRGTYCNVCGEKVIKQEDRKLKYFLGDLLNALTFVDNKLWRTLKLMLLSPGKLSANYVAGKRKKLMSPLAIFFLANLIYFLVPFVNTFTTSLQTQTKAHFIHSDIASKWVNQEIERRGVSFEEYANIYDNKTAELSKLLLIVMAALTSVFLGLIHIGSNRSLLADHLTISVELVAFMLLFGLQLISLLLVILIEVLPWNIGFLFSDLYLTSIIVVCLVYFFMRSERNFYEFGLVRSMVNTGLSVVGLAISLELYRSFLFFITFWSI